MKNENEPTTQVTLKKIQTWKRTLRERKDPNNPECSLWESHVTYAKSLGLDHPEKAVNDALAQTLFNPSLHTNKPHEISLSIYTALEAMKHHKPSKQRE